MDWLVFFYQISLDSFSFKAVFATMVPEFANLFGTQSSYSGNYQIMKGKRYLSLLNIDGRIYVDYLVMLLSVDILHIIH